MKKIFMILVLVISSSAMAQNTQKKVVVSDYCYAKGQFISAIIAHNMDGVPLTEIMHREHTYFAPPILESQINGEEVMKERARIITEVYGVPKVTKDEIFGYLRKEMAICEADLLEDK